MRRALTIISVVLSIGSARAEPLCIAYGPGVRLTGRIHQERTAGVPWTSYDVLVLDDPLCVGGDDTNRQPAEKVASVELMAADGEHAAPAGLYIAVTGELFHSFAPEHRTKVLLAVDDVEFLE